MLYHFAILRLRLELVRQMWRHKNIVFTFRTALHKGSEQGAIKIIQEQTQGVK